MIHHRSTGEAAAVLDVDPDSRIITCIAAPYGQTALVQFRGTTWREQFEPGAFDGADASKYESVANIAVTTLWAEW